MAGFLGVENESGWKVMQKKFHFFRMDSAILASCFFTLPLLTPVGLVFGTGIAESILGREEPCPLKPPAPGEKV